MKFAKHSVSITLKTHNFRAIAAVAENGTIGLGNKIPWHIPEELRFFRDMTKGSTVLFGRKTFESIGKVLPNRRNIILSRSDMNILGGIVVHSVEELLSLTDNAWICGGSSIYQLLLPICRELYVSTIRGNYDGDAKFPKFKSMFIKECTLFDEGQFYVTKFVNKNYHANA
ncbi:MAG: dihydrofolate reductase [Puniceicoccales bacterium]|jgi:dihydrofolate reductase|nr:dihydrofolate reductase [Puniceicoccales bacterium]